MFAVQPGDLKDVPNKKDLYYRIGLEPFWTPQTNVYICYQSDFKILPSFDHVFQSVLSRDLRISNLIMHLGKFCCGILMAIFLSR